VIPADALFRTAANAAAAAFAASPPYLAYRTEVTIDVPSMKRHRVIEREVETRTKDDFARLHDLPNGGTQYAHSFPLIPTFDAISYFRFQFNGSQRDALSYVQEMQPITFSDTPDTHADVVVKMLRYYHASYAPDTTDAVAHILMDALPTLTRGNDSDFYIHDVYVDTATNLPTRVVYVGPTTQFTCDYTVVENHWLVKHASYTHTFYGPFHIGRVTAIADATNTDFRFPPVPSDPKLAQ
jgi:hypothetical protein